MKAEGKWLVILCAAMFIIGGVVFWLVRSAFTPTPTFEVKKSVTQNASETKYNLATKDSGEIKVKIIPGRSGQTADSTIWSKWYPLPDSGKAIRHDTTSTRIYSDSTRDSKQDSIKVGNKFYPIKVESKVSHKIVDNGTKVQSLWEKSLNLIFPMVKETTSTDSVRTVVKTEFITKPWFMDTWFYTSLVITALFVLRLIF